MVAAFPQFHLNIHQTGCRGLGISHAQEGVVVLEDGSVVLLLNTRELNVNDRLFLGRDVLCNILLDLYGMINVKMNDDER